MPLQNLANYYLKCIGYDNAGISVPAQANQNLNYVELNALPLGENPDIFNQQNIQGFLNRARNNHLSVYLGYPCTLKAGNEQRFIEPFFLFPVELAETVNVDTTFPIINQRALERLSNVTPDELTDELIQLQNNLRLAENEAAPGLGELTHRLHEIHPEWQWIELPNADNLNPKPPLSQCQQEGIYNRAVLVVSNRSPYTRGLELELNELAQLNENDDAFTSTALGQWLTGIPSPNNNANNDTFIEAIPLNPQQRGAVQTALQQPLTVITGPPGTGKSQVITSLLINAAFQGKSVLFASKNNKAVDVVEERVNGLGNLPLLLRVGANQYQTRLADYLLQLLNAQASEEDHLAYQQNFEAYQQMNNNLNALENKLNTIVSLRNKVDNLEKQAENARQELSENTFNYLKTHALDTVCTAREKFRLALQKATKGKQGFFIRLFWGMLRKSRFEQLEIATQEIEQEIQPFNFKIKIPQQFDDEQVATWQQFSENLNRNIELAQSVCSYFRVLQELQEQQSMQDITREHLELVKNSVNYAQQLWERWLLLKASKLSQSENRKTLIQYETLLGIINNGVRLDNKQYGTFMRIQKLITHLLPCWAVSSLSAHRRIPFLPGHFDIVVFDEASQCDIASALPLLYRATQAVVIGDAQQLSHISGIPEKQDIQLLTQHELFDTHLQWLYARNSLFSIARGINNDNIIHLREHYRSHKDIIEFSNRFFYQSNLLIATRYNNLNRPLNGTTVRWIDIQGKVERPATGSAINQAEAIAVVKAIKKLVIKDSYEGSVGVASPFRAQANLIQQLINQDENLAQHLNNMSFFASTAHGFQGDERDVMVFSPVLSEGITDGALQFLRNNRNLFNVAITRARAMLLVVGNRNAAEAYDVEYLSNFSIYVREIEQRQDIAPVQQLEGDDYPIVHNQELVSEWERILWRALCQNGIRCIPQYQEEMYSLDLAFFVGNKKLNIEVDGEHYHRRWDGELRQQDRIRNQRMIELGWDVIRFWVYEIRDDMAGCIERVENWRNNQ